LIEKATKDSNSYKKSPISTYNELSYFLILAHLLQYISVTLVFFI